MSDTPGIIGKVDDLLGKTVNLEVPKELQRADVILFLVDLTRPKNEEENKTLGLVRKSGAKKVLVYNKLDEAIGPKNHLPDYQFLEDEFDAFVAVSALKRTHLKSLVNIIFDLLPEGDEKNIALEVATMEGDGNHPVISLPSEEFVAELIREKAYLALREEIPYSVNVVVKSIKEKRQMLIVEAVLETAAERYKKMIIGKDGRKIREIGHNARKEMEIMSGKKVYLDLMVETNPHWQEMVLKKS